MIYEYNNISNLKIVMRNGYQATYLPTHPRAYSDGMVYVHLLVAENILGRHVTKQESVYHKDFDKLNNSPSNLMNFASNKDHVTYHVCLRNNGKYRLECKDNVYRCICESYECKINNLRVNRCPICNNYKTHDAQYCKSCFSIMSCKHPSRDELKRQLLTRNFLKIAQHYGITDNAVRKWCKKESLPYRTTVLRQMTDADIMSL